MRKSARRSGFSLVETLVACAIFAAVIIPTASAFSANLAASRRVDESFRSSAMLENARSEFIANPESQWASRRESDETRLLVSAPAVADGMILCTAAISAQGATTRRTFAALITPKETTERK